MSAPLSPWWITGISDAIACFYASARVRTDTRNPVNKDGSYRTFLDFSARFTITLKRDNGEALNRMRDFFGAGKVTYSSTSAIYQVASIDDLCKYIIPHFNLYPLQTRKNRDLQNWIEVINIYNTYFKNNQGAWKQYPERLDLLQDHISIIKEERSFDYEKIAIDEKTFPNDQNFPWWITGLTDGTGNFNFTARYRERKGYTSLENAPEFSILLRADDMSALNRIQEYLNVGDCNVSLVVRNTTKDPRIRYRCRKIKDLSHLIDNHFNFYPLQTKKSASYKIWKELITLIKEHGGCANKGWWKEDSVTVQKLFNLINVLKEC